MLTPFMPFMPNWPNWPKLSNTPPPPAVEISDFSNMMKFLVALLPLFAYSEAFSTMSSNPKSFLGSSKLFVAWTDFADASTTSRPRSVADVWGI
jgi:hypothetical protein